MTESISSMHRRRLPPLGALRAFESAARHLSFRTAALELLVTPTAISHQIRQLEDWLGLKLFTRGTRHITLTEAGRVLFPPLNTGLDSFERAIALLRPDTARQAVTLSAPTLFTQRRLIPALGTFRDSHPDFDLRLHASDAVVDLTAGMADVAIRYAQGPFPGLSSRALFQDRFGVLCSPSLGMTNPEDLRHVPLLHVDWIRSQRVPNWAAWAAVAGMADLNTAAGPRFNTDDHALQAAIAGHGAVIASLELTVPDIIAGLLVHPFGPTIAGDAYHVVATPANMACADVRAVCDWLTGAVAPA